MEGDVWDLVLRLLSATCVRVALLPACSSLPLLSVEEEEGRSGGRPLPERRGAEEEGRREERGAEGEASSPEADLRGASWGTHAENFTNFHKL